MATTLGKYMVNKVLPPEFRDPNMVLDGDALQSLMARLATERPELYKDVSAKLMKLGAEASFTEGATLRLSDVFSPIDRSEFMDFIDRQERKIRNSGLSRAEKEVALEDLYSKVHKAITESSYATALEMGNPFALQVKSKSRGSAGQLTALMSTPGMYKDGRGRLIPMFVRRSFAEGLKPWEYYGGTFGARAGAISTKLAVPDAGDLGKQLNVMAADLIITGDDCGTTAGVPFDINDDDNIGAVLARDAGGFKAGAVVDKKMLDALKKKGFDKILLRSPITCAMKDGLCKLCAGARDGGKFPNLRDNIGILASSPLSERIAQGSLNVKHTSSAGGSKSEAKYSGFPIIEQLVQVPKAFRHRAAVAESDGVVDHIEKAPQGGFNVYIDGIPHYVSPDQTVEVKPGDVVEAGDPLSSGIVNPAEVVKHKGLGEGRKYLAERLTKAFRDSKLTVNRRNAEVVARALINRVDIDDPDGLGDYLPGDSVAYSSLAYSYVPRADSKVVKPRDAVGSYLEQPALHYTIGTRLTKKMADELEKFKVPEVIVNSTAPGFTAVMERLRGAPAVIRKDWVAKMQGSHLKANLMKDIQMGAESDIHSVNPVPGLAYGVEFGRPRKGEVTY